MTKFILVSFIACPYAQRAVIVMKEKGVDFEIEYIDLGNKPDWFLKISPLGKVPVLRVRPENKSETAIFESAVIVEYIEDAMGGRKLHPADPLDRATHRAWMEFCSTIIADYSKWSQEKDENNLPAMRKTLESKLAKVEEQVVGPYFAGEEFNCVDAAFAPLFMYMGALETRIPNSLVAGLPKLSAWRKKLLDRQSVKDSMPVENYAAPYTDYLEANGSALFKSAIAKAA